MGLLCVVIKTEWQKLLVTLIISWWEWTLLAKTKRTPLRITASNSDRCCKLDVSSNNLFAESCKINK